VELDTLLLADYAIVAEGKLFIQGGGVTEVRAPTFPWVHPQLALVIRFRLDDDEAWGEHTLNLRMVGPNSSFAIPPTDLSVPAAELPDVPDIDRFVQLALTVAPIPFPAPGIYQLELALDGEPLRVLALNVALVDAAVHHDQG
jgi:hypothetical protein